MTTTPPTLAAAPSERRRWGITEWGALASIVGAGFWVLNYFEQRAKEKQAQSATGSQSP